MSSGRQAEAVPSALAERIRNWRESLGIIFYSLAAGGVSLIILAIILWTPRP